MSHLLPLSSPTASGLENLVERCRALLQDGTDPAALCAELAHMPASRHRAVFAGNSTAQLDDELAAFLGGTAAEDVAPILVFAGIGGQWQGMAAGLLESEPVFQRAFQRWSSALAAGLGWSPLELCTDRRIDEMRYTMPCLVTFQASLYELLTAWGIRPAAVVGHSVGEIAAAYVSGSLTFDDTVALVVARHDAERAGAGRGGMAVVAAAVREVEPLLPRALEIAGVNGGAETVIAGPTAELAAAVEDLSRRGLRIGAVRTDVPCHTSLLDDAADALERMLPALTPQPSTVPLFSCTTGGLVDGTALTGRHWRANLRDAVRFDRVLDALLAAGHRAFLEIGPHPTLTTGIYREFDARGIRDGLALGAVIRGAGSHAHVLRAVGQLWARGAKLDLAVVSPDERGSTTLLVAPRQQDEHAAGERPAPIAYQFAAAPPWQRRDLLDGFVRREVTRLTVELAGPLDDESTFSALGLDSARLAELAVRLRTGLGLPVTTLDCYEQPGIRRLSHSLFLRLTGENSSHDDDAGPALLAPDEPISLVGAACRLPGGVSSLEDFWEFLDHGASGVTEVPADRWSMADFYTDGDTPGRIRTTRAGFITDVDRFDADFFGITEAEALRMDPAQRLLLQTVWEALEHAGIDPLKLDGTNTGVFIGSMNTGDYLARKESAGQAEGWMSVYDATSVANSALAGRVSYFLGTVGPAMSVDTACSSSLVALHSAVSALRLGECDMAIVGGVNLIMAPWTSVAFSQARMLSPDGECRTFSADANGYVRGEGCAAVVLIGRSAALKAGLRPLANVIGSAVNQNGRTSGITAPSETAQRRVIQSALRVARRTPSDIGYIEVHGTGTPLGDPIEMRALTSVMASPGRPEWLAGSVKTNIGHLEAAAGMAGLLKAVLAVRNGRIPRHLNITELNPAIDLDAAGARIPEATVAWPDGYVRRAAGVSSFGFTGSVAHVIVEAEPENDTAETAYEPDGLVLPLSARAPETLAELAGEYRRRMEAQPRNTAEICRVAALGRAHFPVRAAVSAADATELIARLAKLETGGRHVVKRPKIAFLFSGQGSQYARMGTVLREREPVFRRTLDEALRVAGDNGVDLRAALAAEDPSVLRDTGYTQPAVFAVQAALLAQLRAWGVTPDMVIGHSLGEFGAAYAAGAVDLASAMRIVCRRALSMAQQPPGSMLAVRMSQERFAEFAGVAPVELATDNSAGSIVLSGTHEAVETMRAALSAAGVECRPLAVSHAFHSAMMDGALPESRAVLDSVTFGEPTIPMVSTVLGTLVEGRLTTEHWLANLRGRVRFREGMLAIAGLEPDVLLEVGPTAVLLGAAAGAVPGARLIASLRGRGDESADLRQMLAELYEAGAEPDWATYHGGRALRRPEYAPTYPFTRNSYWLPFHTPTAFRHAFLDTPAGTGDQITANAELSAASPILDAHRVHGIPVLPAASCLDAVAAVGARAFGGRPAIASCTIHTPVAVRPGLPAGFAVAVDRNTGRFAVTDPGTGSLFADGVLDRAGPAVPAAQDQQARDERTVPGADLRARWDALGLAIGPWLATLGQTVVRGSSFRAALCVPAGARPDSAWWGQVLLDGAFQAAMSVIEDDQALWLPSSFTGVTLPESVPAECTAHGQVVEIAERSVAVRLVLVGADGATVASVERAEFRRAGAGELAGALFGPGKGISRLVLSPVALDGAAPQARRWAVVGTDCQLRKELTALLPAAQPDDADAVVVVLGADPHGSPEVVTKDGLRQLYEAARDILAAPAQVLLHVVVDRGPEYFSAAIRGFCRSFALEEPQRWGGGVELAADAEPGSAAAAVTDVLARSSGEWLTRIRDGLARQVLVPWDGLLPETVKVDAKGRYLVTGGLGALGLVVAAWLVARGAGAVSLIGRSRPSPEAVAAIERMRAAGACVTVLNGDVTDSAFVRSAVEGTPALRGVMHCAGILEDGLLSAQEWTDQQRVLAPKIDGATHLHRETAALDLDFFVAFSSVASCLGAHGQTAYAAANGFLDGLMAMRQASGLPGVSLCWPAWTGAGMAHRDDSAGIRYWESLRGVTSIGPVLSTHLLGRLAAAPVSQLVIGVRPDAARLDDHTSRVPAISGSVTLDQARAVVETALRDALAADGLTGVLGDGSLRDHGLDSFGLIDLRRRLADHGIDAPAARLLGDDPVHTLVEEIAAGLVTAESPAPAGPDRPSDRRRMAELATLGSAFISGKWMLDRFRVGRLDAGPGSVSAQVRAERFVMPADGVYHLPVFQAFLWAELLTDLHARRTGAARAGLRTFSLKLPRRVSTPESIVASLRLTGDAAADFTIDGATGRCWTGDLTFAPTADPGAAYQGAPADLANLTSDEAQACFDHYWGRYAGHDLKVDDVEVSPQQIETLGHWAHAGEPIAPFTLMRWASQLCLIHAHWRLGFDQKPDNEAYVAAVDLVMHTDGVPDSAEIPLVFVNDHEAVYDDVAYLTGTFRAGHLATLQLKLTVPLTDHDRRMSRNANE